MNVTVTPEAVDALKTAIAHRGTETGPSAVRVLLAHQCGCGANKFQMGFSEAEESDNRLEIDGVTLLADPQSASALDGARIEVSSSDNLVGPQFRISTADGGGCGCGGHHS